MVEFLKSLSNTIVIAVTALSIIGIFYGKLDVYFGLGVLALFLFMGFVSLIVYYLFKLDKKIEDVEKKFKRADELVDIKGDINSLKIILAKKMNKKGFSDTDVLEWIKIAIAIIIGWIIIKALLSTT